MGLYFFCPDVDGGGGGGGGGARGVRATLATGFVSALCVYRTTARDREQDEF